MKNIMNKYVIISGLMIVTASVSFAQIDKRQPNKQKHFIKIWEKLLSHKSFLGINTPPNTDMVGTATQTVRM
jgi:hypothetical protein